MSGEKDEDLSESWVELSEAGSGPSSSPVPARPTSAGMERLLLAAQREGSSSGGTSCIDSRTSSKASAKSSDAGDNANGSESPLAEADLIPELKDNEWVWDWSSRPEAIPSSGTMTRFKHPTPSRGSVLSIRNTRLMSGLVYSMENLPLLILTHACSFIIGATTMFICLRRYGNWSAAVVSPA